MGTFLVGFGVAHYGPAVVGFDRMSNAGCLCYILIIGVIIRQSSSLVCGGLIDVLTAIVIPVRTTRFATSMTVVVSLMAGAHNTCSLSRDFGKA